ncbi:MAG: DJ-1/PfpI family protein [Roseburia sp.]|nr:DJ-1/PfpI family protein [Roseburia sp.]
MKKAVMLFANGFEEVEALMTADILMRGGVEVTLASITEEMEVTGSHGIRVGMDAVMEQVDFAGQDAVLIPGGMPGTLNLGDSKKVTGVLTEMHEAGKIVGAICAAPSVLGQCGMLKGKRATCYPGFEEKLTGAEFVDEKAVVDGNVVTSRGLGTSMEFGFALLEVLVSKEKAEEIRKQIVFMY